MSYIKRIKRDVTSIAQDLHGLLSASHFAIADVLQILQSRKYDDFGDIVLFHPEFEDHSIDYRKALCIMKGPTTTPYEGGLFLLEIHFPDNYPFASAQLRFLSNVYHFNVNASDVDFYRNRLCALGPTRLLCSCEDTESWKPSILLGTMFRGMILMTVYMFANVLKIMVRTCFVQYL